MVLIFMKYITYTLHLNILNISFEKMRGKSGTVSYLFSLSNYKSRLRFLKAPWRGRHSYSVGSESDSFKLIACLISTQVIAAGRS